MKLRLVVFSVFLAAAAALVQAKAVNPRTRLGKLGLSDAQKTEIKGIRQQARTNAQPITEKLRTNRQALRAAVKANDAGQIQALSKTQGELRGQALAMRSQTRAKVYADLTAEQRQKLDARQARVQQRLARRQAKHA